MPRPKRARPRDFMTGWPELSSGERVEASVEVARRLSLNLRSAMGRTSTRGVAQLTGVDHTTVADILNGESWPDLMTIARLEAGLRADLWPTGVAKLAGPPSDGDDRATQ